ncbi:cell wall serine-threonine-rich galactomannoprotein Mp1 [Venturia nashicola]|uniref:Cell wall serine-threonine-rich galactomannoprotein Mp1 n=1 Tax=Venturia nashicola TaxID=86259 RepID=A0A4Z1P9V6_9PEZI|nr:cell wall serine-threonine-rich galactomannoprotein Mp1 [Venturia nashicola]
MLLTKFLSLALFTSPITAVPLASPKLTGEQTFIDTSIKDVLTSVVDKTIALSAAVKGFDGNIQNSGPIITASQGLLDTIVNGTKIVQAAHSLSYIGLLAVTGPTLNLNKASEKVSEAVVGKKPLFEKAGLAPVVLGQLKGQQTAAQALVDILLTKVPLGTVTLSKTLSAPSLEALEYAVQVYSGKATING